MSQADGYVRISTLNDTTEAERTTEHLGETIAAAMDTTPVDRMTQATDRLSDALRHTDTAGLDDMREGIDDVGSAAITTGQLIKANLISDTIMSGIKNVGAALKNAALDAISGAMSNETAFAKATTLLEGDTERYFDGIMEISNRKRVEFTNLSEALYSSLSAGVGQEDALDFVEGTVNLAKGGFTQITTAIDIVTTVLNAYQKEMSEAAHVQNVLITTQNKGKTTVDELAGSMGKLIPTAKSVNVEFDHLGAMYATVTANGVATAETTTYLNAMLNELGASGSSAEKAMMSAAKGTELEGKKFAEISAMGYDVTDVLSLMSKEAAKSGQSLADMFSSSEAAKAANILLSNMDSFKENIIAMGDSAGAAAAAAETMMDTTAEKVQGAKIQIQNLTTTVAQSLLPVIGDAAEEISGAFSSDDVKKIAADVGNFASGALNVLLKNIRLIGSALAGVTASVVTYKTLTAGANFITGFNASAKALVSTFQGLRTATDAATTAQVANNAAAAANPYMAVISVIAALIGVFVTLAQSAESATDKIDDLRQSTKDYIRAAEESESAAKNIRKLADEYSELKNASDNTNESKERLAEIQELLLDTYGTEANQLDLVNGKYEEQIKLLKELANAKDEDAEISATVSYNNMRAAEELERGIKYDINMEKYSALKDDKMWEALRATGLFKMNEGEEYAYIRNIEVTGDSEEKAKYFKAILDAYKATGYHTEHSEDYKELAELYERYKKLSVENEAILEQYNHFTSSEEGQSSYVFGEWQNRDYADQAKAQNAARQAELAKATADKAANEELYKQQRTDAKYQYDMGVIDAAEYYAQLAALRDQYLEKDSEEWRSVNVEVKKYYDSLTEDQKKAYEAQLAAQQKAADDAAKARTAAYNEEKSQLQFRLKTNKITEETYYKELAKIRDKYLDKNSSEWRNSFLETYEYNKRIIEENKNALTQMLSDAGDTTLEALRNITSARDSLTAKLVDFNKTFEKITEKVPETIAVKGEFTVTTAEHEVEVYRMDASSIEDNIRVLEEYGAMLEALKARGADDGTMSDILAMDVDEAMEFGTKLLKLSDKDWNSYFDSMARLRSTAEEISSRYYQSEVDNLKDNFIDKLKAELEGLGDDMYTVGADVAAEFVAGWNEALGTKDLTLRELMRAVTGTIDTAPAAARQLTAQDAAKADSKSGGSISKMLNVPIYLGNRLITELLIDATNGNIIKTGKNVLRT